METIACNICQRKDTKILYKNHDLQVVLCKYCSLGFLNPRMTNDEYEQHYKHQYQIARHNIFDKKSAIERLEKKKSYEQKKKHLSFLRGIINSSSSVLEVGSGWGTFLKVIKDEYNCQVKGIELSSLAAQVAKDYYNLSIIEQSLEQYIIQKSSNETYDVIMMHHVLEHFLNPKEMLSSLRHIITPNGYVYIAVPNVAKPDEPIDKFFRIEHTYYFSPTSLSLLLRQSGFSIKKIHVGNRDIKLIAQYSGEKAVNIEKNYDAFFIYTKVKVYQLIDYIKNIFRPVYYKIIKN